ncbi:MAG TPA: hypothetical protein VHO03_15615 [Ignavibacteriales bacterium]|nr:hypothetical protein [Ignavibacteriales bacterium]
MKLKLTSLLLPLIVCSTLYAQVQEAKLLFQTKWNQNETTFQCEISEKDSLNYKIRELNIKDSENNGKILYSYQTIDYPIAVFPLGDDSANLMVTWETGSAFHIKVFSFNSGEVSKVLDTGSKYYPELFFENENSGAIAIMVTNTGWVKNKKGINELVPVSATRYLWNKTGYIQLPDIPWKERFVSDNNALASNDSINNISISYVKWMIQTGISISCEGFEKYSGVSKIMVTEPGLCSRFHKYVSKMKPYDGNQDETPDARIKIKVLFKSGAEKILCIGRTAPILYDNKLYQFDGKFVKFIRQMIHNYDKKYSTSNSFFE